VVIKAKKVSRALLGLNCLLGTGIFVFACRCLLAPPRTDLLGDIHPADSAASPPIPIQKLPDENVLITLHNPLQKTAGPNPPPPFQAILKGALPALAAAQGVAFIKVGATERIVGMGEEILQNAGWRLSELWKDRAAFTNQRGETRELEIESIKEETKAATRSGEAYHPENYRSRRLAFSESREVWGMDEDEVEWAAQNAGSILDRDFQVSPYAGGGVRIETVTPASMGAARGLRSGDVIREVNGRPLNSIADLQTFLTNPSIRPQSGLRLTVERAGKPVVFEYRPLPR
jgi:hypothetical protein